MSKEELGIQQKKPFDRRRFAAAVKELLESSGVDPHESHLSSTPETVVDLWQSRLLDGYQQDIRSVLGEGFEDPSTDLVIIRDISVHGVCPHHLVPFHGVAHVGYLPGGKLHGFGRIARLVDAISHRLTYQEWITRDIVTALVEHGAALGAACVVDVEQLCLMLGENRRGNERVRTQAFAGSFTARAEQRAEFLGAVQSS